MVAIKTDGKKFLAQFDADRNVYKPLVWGSVIVAEDGAQYRWRGGWNNDSLFVESLEWGNYMQSLHLPLSYFPNLAFLTVSY